IGTGKQDGRLRSPRADYALGDVEIHQTPNGKTFKETGGDEGIHPRTNWMVRMTPGERMDKALAEGPPRRTENTEVARQKAPDKAAVTPPTHYQQQREREAPEWSGRTWGGR